MKPKVLFTCCSMHVSDMITSLRNNPDNAEIEIYACNCVEWDLPDASIVDGSFLVPPISSYDYNDVLLEECKKRGINIIMPNSSADLEHMSRWKDWFEYRGVMVSVMPYHQLEKINDKKWLYENYKELMPRQVSSGVSISDIWTFSLVVNKICCKLTNKCGGKGFAVVDDEKARDVELFHRFGHKHYITLNMLGDILRKNNHEIIVQEYHEGKDYTVSLLADHGRVVYMCGYVGHVMEFGSIMNGEILFNQKAYDIAVRLTEELQLDGNIGIDFILKENGDVLLLEINPRINASLPFVAEAGCNMIYYRCMQLCGNPIPESCDIKEGLKMKKYFGTRYYI